MATKSRANGNKNLKALFSVICLCIIALGLIVYFSTQSTDTTKVNEATTVADTTQVQKIVTAKDTTATTTTKSTSSTQSSTTTARSTTKAVTMEQGDTNTPYKSFYKYPCDETVLFGYSEELVKNETMSDYRSHTAVDFKCSAGGKIVAINDGLVLSVEKDNLLGKVIEIDHGGKLVVKYCGMESINVSEGDYVTIGQDLGTLGAVPFESAEEYHLHLEAKLNGKSVNPLDVMGKTE